MQEYRYYYTFWQRYANKYLCERAEELLHKWVDDFNSDKKFEEKIYPWFETKTEGYVKENGRKIKLIFTSKLVNTRNMKNYFFDITLDEGFFHRCVRRGEFDKEVYTLLEHNLFKAIMAVK